MRLPRGLLLLWVVLAVASARAETPSPRRIVVLDLGNPGGLEAQEASYLTDVVRSSALTLPPAQFFVLTRENLMELLPPGTTLETCVGDCEVETGRRVGADFVVSGDLVRLGGQLRAALRLHATSNGELLASEAAPGTSPETLEGPLRTAALALFARLPQRDSTRLLVAGFGGSLGPKPPAPQIGSFEAVVPAGSPVQADVVFLERLQRARRAERNPAETPEERAAAWQAVAERPGENPLRAAAAGRAAEWRVYAAEMKARMDWDAAAVSVRIQDRDRLRRFLALDDGIVPPIQKAAYRAEFHTVYGEWVEAAAPVRPASASDPAAGQNAVAPPAASRKAAPLQRRPNVIGPIALMAGGGVVSLIGLGQIAADQQTEDPHTTPDPQASSGWVVVGLGSAAFVAGVVWFQYEQKQGTERRAGIAPAPGGFTVFGAF